MNLWMKPRQTKSCAMNSVSCVWGTSHVLQDNSFPWVPWEAESRAGLVWLKHCGPGTQYFSKWVTCHYWYGINLYFCSTWSCVPARPTADVVWRIWSRMFHGYVDTWMFLFIGDIRFSYRISKMRVASECHGGSLSLRTAPDLNYNSILICHHVLPIKGGT